MIAAGRLVKAGQANRSRANSALEAEAKKAAESTDDDEAGFESAEEGETVVEDTEVEKLGERIGTLKA